MPDTGPIQAIYDKLNQLSAYHPGTAEIFDDFLQEAGDVVRVVSNGESFDFPIFAQHMTWTGSMLTTMESTGNKQRNALPPLQRREKNRSYGMGRRMTEQEEELHGYYTGQILNKTTIGLISGAMGVVLDQEGNPIIDPLTGEFVWDDENGAEIYSRLLLGPNRAQLISAINTGTGGGNISYAKVDLSASGDVLIEAINNHDTSTITLNASNINLEGYVTTEYVDATIAVVDQLTTENGFAGTIYTNSVRTGALYATSIRIADLGTESYKVYSEKAIYIGSQQQEMYFLGNGDKASFKIPNMVTGATVNASTNTLTLTFHDGSQVDFRKAASVSGAWSGNTYTVSEDSNGQSLPISVAPTVTLAAEETPGSSFKANLVTIDSVEGVPTTVVHHSVTGYLVTSGSDASTVVNACRSSTGTGVVGSLPVGYLYTNGVTEGRNSVNVVKGTWSGGENTFSPSVGTGQSVSVSLTMPITAIGTTGCQVTATDGSTSTGARANLYLYVDTTNHVAQIRTGSGGGGTAIVSEAIPSGGGADSVTGADIDLNGSSATTSPYKPTTALSKSNGEINGFVWARMSSGTWKNLRPFTISYPQETGTGTKVDNLYTKSSNGLFFLLEAGKLYYY